MHPKAPIYSVFLLTTLVSCTTYIDDQDGTPSLFWTGSWGRYNNLGSAYTELAWQGTLSLGNQSGATVTFTFTGTSVGVFGSLWPGETGARSTYVVDNGKPTEFVPSGLQEPARMQFYASGTLPKGEHTLKVTNLGSFLWLDYFEYDDVVASSVAGSGATTTSSPKATTARPSSTTTTTTTARPSPVTITTTASPSHDGESPLSSTSSESSTATSSQANVSGTSPTASSSSSSSATAAPPPLNPLASSSSSESTAASGTSSSPNAPPPPQDAATPEAHTHRLSRGARVGLIAATTAGGVALLALVLLCLARRRRARSRLRLGDSALPSFQNLQPAPSSSSPDLEGDTLHSPTTTSVGGTASLFSTTKMCPSTITTTTIPPSTARSISVCQMHAGEVPAMDAGHACQACARQHQPPGIGPPVRATDGGVSVAGGRLGLSNVYASGPAPSIFEMEEEGEKSTLPPPYPGQD